MTKPLKLLFICTHNRCRSILAEAITNSISNGKIVARSAGSSPQGQVHPLSLHYLNQHKFPVDGLSSQSWNEFESFAPDAILTLCDSAAQEPCPVWFGHSVQVHWGLKDPSKEHESTRQEQAFGHTISVIEQRIQHLLATGLADRSNQNLRENLERLSLQIH